MNLRAQMPVVPTFSIEPVEQRVIGGHTLRLLASAQPVTAQISWWRDGVQLPGATGSVLRIENTTDAHEGFYRAVASLPGGVRWSREVFVTVDVKVPAPGVLDTEFFTPGLSGVSVDAILSLPDGRVVIGGKFQIGGQQRNLAVLREDGLLDPDFSPQSYPDGRVWALAISRGRLIIGGDFKQVNGVSCGGIAALDMVTGSLAPGWNHALGFTERSTPPMPGEPVPRILALDVDASGRVIAGGTFWRWRSGQGVQNRRWLLRLEADGEPDPSFMASAVGGGEVRDIAVLGDGRIAVVGSFTAPSARFTILANSGALAPGFALSSAPSARVRTVLPLPDGAFLIGGDFTNIGDRLARYSDAGILDSTFDTGTDNDVNALALDGDGGVVVGGLFTTISGVPSHRIARLGDPFFRTNGLDDEVNALATGGGKIFAGGNFSAPHAMIVRVLGSMESEDGMLELLRSPVGKYTTAGGALDLSVAVSPVRADQQFTWIRNGEVVAESDQPTFSLDRATVADAGAYQVVVSDPTGQATSDEVRVGISDRLPGEVPEHRFRGTALPLPPSVDSFPSISISENFIVRDLCVTLDIRHPDTYELEIWLVSPGGIEVRLFEDEERRGRDLSRTTFNDAAGGDASIDDGFPPYTGVYQPNQPLSKFDGSSVTGNWILRVENSSIAPGELIDWHLVFRTDPTEVTFFNYRTACGHEENEGSRLEYAIARGRQKSGDRTRSITGGLVHTGWSAPQDLSYSYERWGIGGWRQTQPQAISITRFPDGTERREIIFQNPATNRAYYRLRAEITDP